ncbi:MAG: hypothetical protein ACT4OP_03015 [Actinomycetota bacterium]
MAGLAQVVQKSAAHGGYITRAQILELGLTDGFIAHALRIGSLTQILTGVYQAIHLPGDIETLRGAVLALPDATVSHLSAAQLHRLPYLRRGEPTVVVHHRTTHEFPGVIVRRSLDLAPQHRTVIDGLAVTTSPRTLVDLAADLHPAHLERVVDSVLSDRLDSYERLRTTFEEVARRGRPGTQKLRAVLSIRGNGFMVTATQLERLGHRVLQTHGVEEPIPQFPIPWDPDRRFDDAYPFARFALEWDSRRWHSALAAMEDDRRRDRECAVHTWLLMRITWHDLKQRPETVAGQVATVLEQRQAMFADPATRTATWRCSLSPPPE